jgi:hypothetical protein
MKLLCRSLLAAAGLAIMAWAHFGYLRLDPASPWSSALLFLDDRPRDAPRGPTGLKLLPLTVRELPPGPIAAAVINALGAQGGDRRRSLAAQLCTKLLLVDPNDIGIGPSALQSGRMPRPGRDEILAGCQAAARDRLATAGHDFTVVGVLRRDVALLVDCYVVPPHPSLAAVFGAGDEATHPALLLQLTAAEIRDGKVREKLKTLFPPDKFTAVIPWVRADRGPYYLYLAGEGLLLLGGSLALIALYGLLSRRIGWSVVRDPLAELAARPKLLGTLHLLYFGLVLLAADPHNPLGVAAKAYHSLNIPRAAAVTFGVNFFLGSCVVITLPSLVVPGSGVLLAVIRATLWGLLLAPTFVLLSFGMLAHSGTLLLEGEGYILAAFFGLLVPLYLLHDDQGRGILRRYGRALVTNLKAMIVVAVVLAVAACYEAVEVILMAR